MKILIYSMILNQKFKKQYLKIQDKKERKSSANIKNKYCKRLAYILSVDLFYIAQLSPKMISCTFFLNTIMNIALN